MLFTLLVAVLVSVLWALGWFFVGEKVPHDPSTLELAAIGVLTLATFTWMKRLQAIRERTIVSTGSDLANRSTTPVPVRYAEAAAEADQEAALESAGRVA